MRPVIKLILLFFILIITTFFVFFTSGFDRHKFLVQDNSIFYDRNGKILRFIPDQKGERHIWIKGEEIPDIVKKAFIAVEDGRFYVHPGFDIIAIVRAFKDNVMRAQIISGASTITQQLVRLTYPRKRTYPDKFIELLRSIQVELAFSKNEILEYYLNRVPMGNNIVGVELASQLYFGKRCRDISISEAAVLASLPKAPSRLNPYGKKRQLLLKRKNYVLKRMAEEGLITDSEFYEAINVHVAFQKFSFPFRAPHLVDILLSRKKKNSGNFYTTIDFDCQREVEKILLSHKMRLASRGAHQAAAMVVHNPTMEVLASVGSLFYSSDYGGYNKGQAALRSAGSTLKPFAYAEALETGFTASTVIKDTLKNYRTPTGTYIPSNYDRSQYGPVTLRAALGNSFNVSAIKVLEKVTVERFYHLLKRIHLMNFRKKGADTYGLGLVIGNGEVSLEQLVTAYAMLANHGIYRKLLYLKENGGRQSVPERVFSHETAYIISDILSDPTARMITFGRNQHMDFPFRVSLKTGTSTWFRDGWIIGYTPEYTVGVWTGNFDGMSTYGLSGAEGAAPIFKDIMNFLYQKGSPSLTSPPKDITKVKVCSISGKKPGPFCQYITEEVFIQGTEPLTSCSFHQKDRHHRLPASYAAWISERALKGIPDNYRLHERQPYNESVLKDNDTVGKKRQIITIKKRKELSANSDVSAKKAEKPKYYSIGTKAQTYSSPTAENTIAITNPLPGDRFIFDRHHLSYQVIELQAVSQKPVAYIDWYIDGIHYARTGPPYYSYWTLKRGKHIIVAASSDHGGEAIEIFVE